MGDAAFLSTSSVVHYAAKQMNKALLLQISESMNDQ